MKLWELEYACAAHRNHIFRFAAIDYEAASKKGQQILNAKYTEHGPHGGYTHNQIVRLDYITDFLDIKED